jgi:hypothetical protein
LRPAGLRHATHHTERHQVLAAGARLSQAGTRTPLQHHRCAPTASMDASCSSSCLLLPPAADAAPTAGRLDVRAASRPAAAAASIARAASASSRAAAVRTGPWLWPSHACSHAWRVANLRADNTHTHRAVCRGRARCPARQVQGEPSTASCKCCVPRPPATAPWRGTHRCCSAAIAACCASLPRSQSAEPPISSTRPWSAAAHVSRPAPRHAKFSSTSACAAGSYWGCCPAAQAPAVPAAACIAAAVAAA